MASIAGMPKKRKAAALVKKVAPIPSPPTACGYPIPACCRNNQDGSVLYSCMQPPCNDRSCNGAMRTSMVLEDMRMQLTAGMKLTRHFDGFKMAVSEFGFKKRSRKDRLLTYFEFSDVYGLPTDPRLEAFRPAGFVLATPLVVVVVEPLEQLAQEQEHERSRAKKKAKVEPAAAAAAGKQAQVEVPAAAAAAASASASPVKDVIVKQEPVDPVDYLRKCAICTEFSREHTTLPACSHLFCTSCIREWLQRDRTCPTCRASAQPLV